MFKKMAINTITPQENTQELIQQLKVEGYNNRDILYQICNRYISEQDTTEPLDYTFFNKGIKHITEPENSLFILLNNNNKNKFAQFFIAQCYTLGLCGFAQCNKTAVKWYRQAEKQGLASAKHNLGYMYNNGYGVNKNLVKASPSSKCALCIFFISVLFFIAFNK